MNMGTTLSNPHTHDVHNIEQMIQIINANDYKGLFVFSIGTAKKLNKAVIQLADISGNKITFLISIESIDMSVIHLTGCQSIVDAPYFVDKTNPKLTELKFSSVGEYKSFLWKLRKQLIEFKNEVKLFK